MACRHLLVRAGAAETDYMQIPDAEAPQRTAP
jgi:hypothetical protein